MTASRKIHFIREAEKNNININTVMADKELDVEEERVYAVTTKEDVDKASGIFVDLIAPLFTLLMIMSTVVFYSFVSLLLTGRLNRMTPAEVLKNRE